MLTLVSDSQAFSRLSRKVYVANQRLQCLHAYAVDLVRQIHCRGFVGVTGTNDGSSSSSSSGSTNYSGSSGSGFEFMNSTTTTTTTTTTTAATTITTTTTTWNDKQVNG